MHGKNSKPPSITVLYVCVCGIPEYERRAMRFGFSYLKNPPGAEHRSIVVFNNGRPTIVVKSYLAGLGPYRSHFHNNSGWDIGAILSAKALVDTDMLVCFGSHVHFHRAGWLARISESWQTHGPGMYGCLSSYAVRPHLNTSAFAIAPNLLSLHHGPMVTRADRYRFEHGSDAFWRQVQSARRPAMLVTWDGEYSLEHWRDAANILWRGDQSNCLVWDNHTDAWASASIDRRARWSKRADGLNDPAWSRR